MSTRDYPLNGITYKIGVGGVASWVGKQGKDINTFDIIWPTYGKWAGPSWANNHRVSKNDTINWDDLPCMNSNIEKDSAVPDLCYSLIDAICKHHDWEYELAEHSTAGNEASLKIAADIQLLVDINSHLLGGTYACKTGVGSIKASDIAIGNYTTQTKIYESTSLDMTELKYAADASIAFTFKMVPDTLCVTKQAVVNTFESIWGYVTDTLGDIITCTDGNQTITTEKINNNNIVAYLCICDGEKARLLATDVYKVYNIGIDLGDGSMATASNFVYEGNGKISLYGGTDNDTITIAENENATYSLNGGGGFDVYYLTNGNSYFIADSGANDIKVKDENGGWYSVGNMYADATGSVWYSSDKSIQLKHSSPWTITFADGTTVVLGESFQTGDFGINLITLPTTPTEYNPPITGDLTPVDFDPATEGIQTQTDEWGNVITDPNQPSPDRADTLFDTIGNDLILSGGGDDVVYSLKGGNNRIQGGTGCDILDGDNSSGCIIEGDADSDIIFGGINGNSQLFGDTYGDMAALIAQGEDAQDNGLKGDIVAVCYGDNYLYGSAGGDIMWGGTGRDLIVAGGGNDLIIGDGGDITANYGDNYTWSFSITEDNDVYTPAITGLYSYDMNAPSGDADVIYAGTGNDYVDAGGGDDEIYGGEGNDTLFGEAGYDFIEGGTGDDILIGDNGELLADSLSGGDYIDGGAGHDEIDGNAGNDELFGGADNDTIYGDAGDDYLDGEAGADSLYGGGGADVMFGGDHNDYMEGDNYDVAGDDYLDGEAGNDTIIGAGGADVIFGGADNDSLYGDATNVAVADQGADYIDGEGGNNLIVGFGGNDTLYALDGNDTIYGGDGNDYIDAGDGVNMVLGGADNDDIWAGKDNDWIQGDAGNDYLDGGAGNNTLIGGDGDDVIFGGIDDDILQGDDSSGVAPGNDYLEGLAGNDTLIGLGGNDTLFGDEGDDHIQGDTGDDYLDGGADHDYMMGMDGADTVFGGEDNDSVWGGAGNDKIYGEAGDDQLAGEAGDDYLDGGTGNDFLQGGAGSDILIGGAGSDTYFFNLGDGIDTIDDTASDGEVNILIFGDGITFNILQLNVGSLDILIGDNGDVIHFDNFDPNDAYGLRAIDSFEFADGTALTYSELIDLGFEIEGTSGDDQLSGTSASDSIYGMEGNDSIVSGVGADVIDGGAGDDTLYGGTGNDTLTGGEGNDTYLFNLGDGVDTIVDYAEDSPTTTDIVQFGTGIDAMQLQVTKVTNDLQISIIGTDDVLIIQNWSSGEACRPEKFVFADSTIMTAAQMDAMVITIIYGTDGNDTLSGDEGADIMIGRAENDTYVVNNIGDVVTEKVDEGTDTVLSSIDYLLPANVENLTLTGAAAINGYGNDLNNVINGNDGDNILSGSAGNDTMYGEGGNDAYLFGCGDGVDTIYNYATDGATATDTVVFGEGITFGDLEFVKSVGDSKLMINIKGTTNSLIVKEQLGVLDDWKVDQFQFADGTIITAAQIEANGFVMYGTAGKDTLSGGAGADTMIGGKGNDMYIVNNIGDIVTERANEGTDTVLSSIDYLLPANVENLTLTGAAAINGYGNDLNNVINGNDGDNILSGSAGNDTIYGGAGNDSLSGGYGEYANLYGGDGNDTLDGSMTYSSALVGGDGNDSIRGGSGDDILSGGNGDDKIYGGQGNDTYYMDDLGDIVIIEYDNEGDAVYYVDGLGDTVIENANEGNDTMRWSGFFGQRTGIYKCKTAQG
jgi:Ca2+-binding RTX toxin-like protein